MLDTTVLIVRFGLEAQRYFQLVIEAIKHPFRGDCQAFCFPQLEGVGGEPFVEQGDQLALVLFVRVENSIDDLGLLGDL